jgi:hypothetical protein
MGTEAGRNVFGSNLWVASLIRRLERRNHKYVITDARFPNELKAIKQAGGHNIHIVRGRYPDWYQEALKVNSAVNFGNDFTAQFNPIKGDEIPGVHYSEWAWVGNPNIETIITNDGTIEQLKNALAVFISQH